MMRRKMRSNRTVYMDEMIRRIALTAGSLWQAGLWLLCIGMAAAADTGTIVGRVVDSRTGMPIAYAAVEVGRTDFVARTDDYGKYSFPAPSGLDSLWVNMLGYIGQMYSNVLVIAGQTIVRDFRLATTWRESESLLLQRPHYPYYPRDTIRLIRPSPIEGKVTELYSGLPIANAYVWADHVPDCAYLGAGGFAGYTDSTGAYWMPPVRHPGVRMVAWTVGYDTAVRESVVSPSLSLDFQLRRSHGHPWRPLPGSLGAVDSVAGPRGTIVCKIMDYGSFEPIVGAVIELLYSDYGAQTDYDGEAKILGVPSGIWSVEVTAMGYSQQVFDSVVVRANQPARIEFRLTANGFYCPPDDPGQK